MLAATVEGVDHGRRVATLHPSEGEAFELPYDVLVMAPGSVSRALPIPGLAEVGIGFKTIGEAVHLRNHILSRLDVASTEAPVVRRQRLDNLPYKVRGEAEPQQRTRRRGLVEAHLRGRLFVYPQHLLRLRGWGMEARLGREEYDLFMPGIPYEEFVEAQ